MCSVVLAQFKNVPGGIPKSDLLGVTVARIHVGSIVPILEAIGLTVVKLESYKSDMAKNGSYTPGGILKEHDSVK